jgi:hypothetical protein
VYCSATETTCKRSIQNSETEIITGSTVGAVAGSSEHGKILMKGFASSATMSSNLQIDFFPDGLPGSGLNGFRKPVRRTSNMNRASSKTEEHLQSKCDT